MSFRCDSDPFSALCVSRQASSSQTSWRQTSSGQASSRQASLRRASYKQVSSRRASLRRASLMQASSWRALFWQSSSMQTFLRQASLAGHLVSDRVSDPKFQTAFQRSETRECFRVPKVRVLIKIARRMALPARSAPGPRNTVVDENLGATPGFEYTTVLPGTGADQIVNITDEWLH